MSSVVLDQNDHAAATDYALEDRFCPGCKESVINDKGGLVVAFGQSFFHLDCFCCAKCGDKVTADTNLLLLSDGSPICANCSYSCNICKLPILDEAIMTGDDAYHAHCFKCKICKNRIDELIFAKTSNGIYCMNCHNDRMAKIRERARRKKEKELGRHLFVGGTGSVKSREGLASNSHQAVDGQSGTQQLENPNPPRPPLAHQDSLTVPGADGRSIHHQPSTESLALQLNVPADPESAAWLLPSSGTTSKRDKRNSINPAFSLGPIGLGSPPTSSSSVLSGSTMVASSITRSPPPLTSSGRNSPSLASPRRDAFPLHAPSLSSRHSSISSLPPVDETMVHPSSAQLPITRAQAEERINTRARAASATLPYDTPEVQRPPLKSNLTLERVPMRSHSLNPSISSIVDLPTSPDPTAASSSFSPHQGGGRLSPVPNLRMQRSFDERPRTPPAAATGTRLSSSSVNDLRAAAAAQSGSRSVSPSHMADVPTGIEDSSDEADVDSGHGMSVDSHEVDHQQRPSSLDLYANAEQQQQQQQQPPPVPLKAKPEPLTLQQQDPSSSESPSTGTQPSQPSTAASDDLDEFYYYPAEQRTSIATFIAPALPPIRFSMNGSDFSELLMSVGGNAASLKNLDQLGRLADQDPMAAMKTPPPSAATEVELEVPLREENEGENGAVVPGTPMSEITITGQPPPAPQPPPPSLSQQQQQSRDMGVPEMNGSATPNSTSAIVPPSSGSSPASSSPPAPNPDNERTPKKASSLKRTGSVGGPRPSTAGSSRSPTHNHSHSNSNSSIHRLRTASGSPSEPQSSTTPSSSLSPSPTEPSTQTRTMTEVGTLGAATAASATTAAGLRSSPSLRRTGRQMTEPPMSQSQQQNFLNSRPHVLFTPPEDQNSQEATAQLTMRSLREALAHAQGRGAEYIRLEKGFVEVILSVIEQKAREHSELRSKLDGAKRASKQYIEGLTVAQDEYDHELKARRAAEAEVMQLKVLLSGQAARLTALASETKTQEIREQKTQEMSQSLDGLQKHLSQLRVERDITLAEVEELTASKSIDSAAGGLGRSLSVRLDTIKSEYKNELVPLQHQREQLMREIDELKSVRSLFLEETTVLNARNEELSRLNAQYMRRLEQLAPNPNVAPPVLPIPVPTTVESPPSREELLQPNRGPSFDGDRSLWMETRSSSMTLSSSHTLVEERDSAIIREQMQQLRMDSNNNFPPTPRQVKKSGIGAVKWPGSLKAKEVGPPTPMKEPSLSASGHIEHAWQQSSNIRFARCEQCGDKMWGSQLRCTGCNISIHPRCLANVHSSCSRSITNREEAPAQVMSIPPSMFGRELTEQVKADIARGFTAPVPVIVTKCIEAVEALALDFEGIYRKTGGSGQSKIITQLFERGDYASFDLRDQDRFNDICSVTSVLKNYFRSLPTPLLTFDLHDDFMMAAEIKDMELKGSALTDLVRKLPLEHHETLRVLMLHLYRVREQSEINLMNARNLGVVFGPTLMRSRDPTAEFSDMAGKALTIEWLVDNAPVVFTEETQA